MKRCLSCMEIYEKQLNICPHCGYCEGNEDVLFYMQPGTVINSENNSYIIGKILDSDDIGNIYIAWDNALERKVTIKEYMPYEYSTRVKGTSKVEICIEKRDMYNAGMEKFVDEATKLVKFEEEGIIRIFDYFYQNNSAYIVMEYLDGMTLAEYIAYSGRFIPEMAVNMLMPLMKSLNKAHKIGIIHKAISPTNIIITKDGQMKLIDFGAERFKSTEHSRSLTVLMEQGYSPEEQYRERGKQGAYTDVYSLAATMYKMITGITPPNALERRFHLESGRKDRLVPVRKYSRKITRSIENAIYNGMCIQSKDRTANIEQFICELTADKPAKLRHNTIRR